MEWIDNSEKPNPNGVEEGHILCPTFEFFKESLTWCFTPGSGWNLLTLTNNQGRRYNAMMKAEIDMIK